MKNRDLVMLAVIGLGVLLFVGQGSADNPKQPDQPKQPDPPKPPDPAPDTSLWVPYDPTPPQVAKRAAELLKTMRVGDRTIEPDPAKKYWEIEYRCTVHPPSQAIPTPHPGVDVWRPPGT